MSGQSGAKCTVRCSIQVYEKDIPFNDQSSSGNTGRRFSIREVRLAIPVLHTGMVQ